MLQCVAQLGGLDVQVSARMSRTPGVTPDVGTMVWTAQTPQPAELVSDLVFRYGNTEVARFTQCRIWEQKIRRRERSIDVVYAVADRRWKWREPVLFGSWNVKQADGTIVPGLEKTPQELAELALDALQETGYDVTVLPTDATLAPEVHWHYEPAAQFLDRLCAQFGCEVHLNLDDTVAIRRKGIGSVPDGTGLVRPPETGMVISRAPDYITAYAGDTLFESWLVLEPVGVEIDGEIRPIEQLSYRPERGWVSIAFGGHSMELWDQLAGEPKPIIERKIELATRHVYRTFRVIGFPPGMMMPPGFESEEFPSYTNETTEFQVIRPSADWSEPPTVVGSAPKRWKAEQIRLDDGQIGDLIVPPGVTALDHRLLTPLDEKRLKFAIGPTGELERMPAEIIGTVEQPFDPSIMGERVNVGRLKPYRGNFSISGEDGTVTLDAPAFTWELDDTEPDDDDKMVLVAPELYLRVAYRLRDRPYGSIYHRQMTIPTGLQNGTANGLVDRTDIHQQYIQEYTSDYDDLSQLGDVYTNTQAVDATLSAAATERLREYENIPTPQTRVYSPFRAVDTDGIVRRVEWRCGAEQNGYTIVHVGATEIGSPAIRKRQRELQNRLVEMEFRGAGDDPGKKPRGKRRGE